MYVVLKIKRIYEDNNIKDKKVFNFVSKIQLENRKRHIQQVQHKHIPKFSKVFNGHFYHTLQHAFSNPLYYHLVSYDHLALDPHVSLLMLCL